MAETPEAVVLSLQLEDVQALLTEKDESAKVCDNLFAFQS